jgi:hypothetical protein
MQLMKHPLTDLGLERFLADWEQYRQAAATSNGAS